jgi:hypothetical protein
MSRRGASITLVLSGLLMLPACGSGELVGHSAIRVASVVHIGPYTQVFASPLPANPVLADVVEAFREGEVLWNKSENARHLVPAARDYVTGQALTHLAAAMKAGRERDLVPAGVDRLFMTRVTTIAGRSATVTTCDDASKFQEQNPSTGQVDTSFVSPPGQDYLFETWRMVQLRGHWAIASLSVATLPSRSAEPCQPGIAGSALPRRPDVGVLVREMSAAVDAASSAHISGVVRHGGKTLGLNLGITRSGEFSGQISVNGALFTVLATRGHTYIKQSSLSEAGPPALRALQHVLRKIPEVPSSAVAQAVPRSGPGIADGFPDQRAGSQGQVRGRGDHQRSAGLAAARFAGKLALRGSPRQALHSARGRSAQPGQREPDAVGRGADPRSAAREPDREPSSAGGIGMMRCAGCSG